MKFNFLTYDRQVNQQIVPIYFEEYGITIVSDLKIGDTLFYSLSDKEKFKIVFYNSQGECYCERYVENFLIEKGKFRNSLDTLKRYISSRFANGKQSKILVQNYFQPLKTGEWIIYKDGAIYRERYENGVKL